MEHPLAERPRPPRCCVLLYLLRGRGEAMNEALEIALYVVAFFLAAIVPTFLWNLWLAPYKIMGENINSLSQEVTALRGALEKRSKEAQDVLDAKAQVDTPLSDRAVWLVSPGAGRIAARLIMTAPDFEEAQLIYDAYRAASNREHEDLANYAFLRRLDLEGHGAEVYALAEELAGKHEGRKYGPRNRARVYPIIRGCKERAGRVMDRFRCTAGIRE